MRVFFFLFVYLLIYNKCPFIQGLGLTVHDKKMAQAIGVRLRNLLKLPKAHKWVCYEWFYSNLDMWVECSDFLAHGTVLNIMIKWIKQHKWHVYIHLFFLILQTPISDGKWLLYLHEGVFSTVKDEEAEEGGVVQDPPLDGKTPQVLIALCVWVCMLFTLN